MKAGTKREWHVEPGLGLLVYITVLSSLALRAANSF
jgi:hypothetical protein